MESSLELVERDEEEEEGEEREGRRELVFGQSDILILVFLTRVILSF